MTDRDKLLEMAMGNVICLHEEQNYREIYYDLDHSPNRVPDYITPVEIYENLTVNQLLETINNMHDQFIKIYNMGAHQGCLHKIIV